MKYIGIFLIISAFFGIGSDYSSRKKRGLAECEGFLALVKHIRLKISCYLCPTDKLLSDFECDALSKCGFIPLVLSGVSMADAFIKCHKRLMIGKEEKRIISSLFASLGEGYLADALKELDGACAALEERTALMRESVEKSVRVSGVLSSLASLALLILLI